MMIVDVVLTFAQVFVFIYDVVTYPVYHLLSQPWKWVLHQHLTIKTSYLNYFFKDRSDNWIFDGQIIWIRLKNNVSFSNRSCGSNLVGSRPYSLLNVTFKPVCRPVCKLRQSKHLIWIYYQEVGPANDETCVINVVFLLGQIVAEVLLFVSQRST